MFLTDKEQNMPFPANKTYGVLVASIDVLQGTSTSAHSGLSHFNGTIKDDTGTTYQMNIDTQSEPKPDVRVFCNPNFDIAKVGDLSTLASGFNKLETEAGGLALDLIRKPLFDINSLAATPTQSAEQLGNLLLQNIQVGGQVYVFGTFYDDSKNDSHESYRGASESYRDKHMYGARRSREQSEPAQGIDDIHLNQGTPASEYQARDNGTYQDGALFAKQADGTWTAFFFAFDGQCLSTDDAGNCNP